MPKKIIAFKYDVVACTYFSTFLNNEIDWKVAWSKFYKKIIYSCNFFQFNETNMMLLWPGADI